MAQTKPLFVPWLYEQIQSGRYPGVCWKNNEKTQFSIPWKHASRQDTNNDDVLIFKAWAQTSTGRDGKIHEDPSVWKRNFRSALRAKGFKMILDNKNDAANPLKVYLFPTESNSAGAERFQQTDASHELYFGEEEVLTTLPSNDLDLCLHGLNLQECSTQESYGCSTEGAVGGLDQNAFVPFSSDKNTYETAPCYPEVENVGYQNVTHMQTGTLETYFQIKVYYKGKIMLDHLLQNDSGFRLVFQENIDSGAKECSLPVVNLPCPNNIHDQMQAMLTKEILENLGGLELQRSDGIIFGHRWGKTKVYWGICKHEKSQTARELSKNTPEAIYFFKDYISGLMQFIQKSSGPSPSYTLYFFLGEKWPDPKMKPWEKKLVMIEIVLTSLEALKTMAVAHGASSLQSMELQVSLEQMMELC